MSAPIQSFTRTVEPWHGVDRAPMEQAREAMHQMLLDEVMKSLEKMNRELGLTN